MKKLLAYISFLIFSFSFCCAQDTIVLNNGERIGVKISALTDEIVYTKPPSDKPLAFYYYQVKYIKYADGSIYTVNRPNISSNTGKIPIPYKDSLRKVFAINTDLAQYGMPQPNIGFEYHIIPLLTIGINAGLVYPSSVFAVNPLANGQFTYPGTVYSGYALRIYLKVFLSPRHMWYMAVQGVYKSLSFNNVNFLDQYGDTYTNTYTMNENTTTYGIEILNGVEVFGSQKPVDLDFLYGFGIHQRNRNYSITNQSFGNYGQPPYYESQGRPIAYDGNYTDVLDLFTPVLGFKVGFNYVKKK